MKPTKNWEAMEITYSYKPARALITTIAVLGTFGSILGAVYLFIFDQPFLGGYSIGLLLPIWLNYALAQAVFDISDNIYFVARLNERVIGKLDKVVEAIKNEAENTGENTASGNEGKANENACGNEGNSGKATEDDTSESDGSAIDDTVADANNTKDPEIDKPAEPKPNPDEDKTENPQDWNGIY